MHRLLTALAASTLLLGACSSDPSTTEVAPSSTSAPSAPTTTSDPTGTTAAPPSTSTDAAADVDRSALPIGDGKVADEPTVGSVFSCQTSFPTNGPGGFATGDWFDADAGTFDATTKPTIDGAVEWPDATLDIELDGDVRTIVGNDLPDHATGTYPVATDDDAYAFDRNPNRIAAQDLSFALPAVPEVADEPTCVSMGAIGVLTTGAWFFNALDAGGRDAVAHEIQDACDGHPEMTGGYHYHALSSCVDDDGDAGGHSALVGYARDGFGIYGPRGVDGAELTTSDLDECHGHTHEVDWDGESVELFHYHATADYPYTVACYRGTPT